MQVAADQPVLDITEVTILLVSIRLVHCLYIIVLLAYYSTDISLNLLSVLASMQLFNIIKTPDICYKLSFNNINYYLLLTSNA